MEVLNVFLVVLAAMGSALANPRAIDYQQARDLAPDYQQARNLAPDYQQARDLAPDYQQARDLAPDYQQARDLALDTLQITIDHTKEIAEEAIVKIEDIIDFLLLATEETRFGVMHVTNFATSNNQAPLSELGPVNPRSECMLSKSDMMKKVTTWTGENMVKCFTDKVTEAVELLEDTRELQEQADGYMTNAVASIENCTEIACIDAETTTTVQTFTMIQTEVARNVASAEVMVDPLTSDIDDCLGHMLATFIGEVGKLGANMVSCFLTRL